MAKSRKAAAGTSSLRALNRATLARQMLLAREATTPVKALTRLVGLQAQWPRPPFVGLWTRVVGFQREALARLVHGRKVVRATSLRGTLHLMNAKDYLELRPVLQATLARGTLAVLGSRARGIDVEQLVADARAFFAPGPRTFEQLRDVLARRHPQGDIRAMAYVARTHLALVQVPEEDQPWGYAAAPAFALAEPWLGKRLGKATRLEPLALRYLAAFGPASAADFATWSGVPGPEAREIFGALAPRMTRFSIERRELLDLPDAPRPGADAAAPARFLPEFDDLVLAHADRRRFVAEEHRKAVFLPGLRVAPTFLVDGFVAGTWAVERKKDAVALGVMPFAALPKGERDALAHEAEGLLRLLEPDARKRDVRFAKP